MPPRIITARSMGLAFQNKWGNIGAIRYVTGHYSAGTRAKDWREGVDRAKSFHADHRDHPEKRWGGCGYHYIIADDGALICVRPAWMFGAHVGAANSGNIGINCPGMGGDRPTPQQKATYQWLLANAHTAALPAAHRAPGDLRSATLKVHQMWEGQPARPPCARRESARRTAAGRRRTAACSR